MSQLNAELTAKVDSLRGDFYKLQRFQQFEREIEKKKKQAVIITAAAKQRESNFHQPTEGATSYHQQQLTNFLPSKEVWASIIEEHAAKGADYRIPNFGISKTPAFAKVQTGGGGGEGDFNGGEIIPRQSTTQRLYKTSVAKPLDFKHIVRQGGGALY